MPTIGQSILLWRIHRGLTQGRLSERSGIPRPNLSRIESDKHDLSLKTVRSIAMALQVTPGTLVDGRGPEPKPRSSGGLSRQALERIAGAAGRGRKLANPAERAIAENLRLVMSPHLRALNAPHPPPDLIGRKAERAWLKLSDLSSRDRDSLIQRALEYASTAKPRPH